MAEEDVKQIERYRDAIKEADRVSGTEYERRLAVCKECDLLNAGTCAACGCYVADGVPTRNGSWKKTVKRIE